MNSNSMLFRCARVHTFNQSHLREDDSNLGGVRSLLEVAVHTLVARNEVSGGGSQIPYRDANTPIIWVSSQHSNNWAFWRRFCCEQTLPNKGQT